VQSRFSVDRWFSFCLANLGSPSPLHALCTERQFSLQQDQFTLGHVSISSNVMQTPMNRTYSISCSYRRAENIENEI